MAVVDALIHDECLRIAADTENVPEEERLHVAMLGIRRMIVEADSFRGFFDILPHAFRDPELRERMFSLYVWWYQQNLRWLGPRGQQGRHGLGHAHGARRAHRRHPRRPVRAGGPQPRGFDLSRPLATLEFLLRNSMEQLVEIAEREAGQDEPAAG